MTSVLIATSDKSAGGIERALHDQLALLGDEAGVSITCLAPPSAFADHAQNHHQLISFGKWRKAAFRHLPALSHLGLAGKYDIALCHNGFMARSLRHMAKQVIGICHNDKPHHFKGCDKLVCLTPDGRDKAIAAGWDASQIALIPHYHEADAKRSIPAPTAPITVGAAGRMVGKKNLGLFIEIAARVKQTHPDIIFQLGGTGPLYDEIEALNAAKGHPVRMLGWVDFDPFLAALDIMIVPSLDEPFGYIFPEAMAQGVAMLSTPTCGANYCLEQGKIAPLYQPDDAAGFAAEICRLADDKAGLHKQQQACYQAVLTPRFTKQKARDSWADLLAL